MQAPGAHQHIDQADVEKLRRGPGDLAGRRFMDGAGQVVQGPAELLPELLLELSRQVVADPRRRAG
jgi:hypothetical protein